MAKRTKKDETEVEADEDRNVIVEPQSEIEQPIEPTQLDEVLTVTDDPDATANNGLQPDEDLPPVVHARDLVTVKFIGPNCAVLGNATILQGETRENVSRAMLARAEQAHPGEFEIVE